MSQIHDNLLECLHNESNGLLVPESNGLIRYKRKCNYAKPESCTEYKDKFEFISDVTSRPVNDICVNEESNEQNNGKITAKVVDYGFCKDENKLTIHGPQLSVKYTIKNIKPVNYDRKFGIIQLSSIFFERKYDNAILRVDFLENLLRGRDVVLDCVDGNDLSSYRPFYSEESFQLLRANEIPPDEIKLRLSDCPDSTTPLESNHGSLEYLERHQKFYVYLLMMYWDGGEWRYKVSNTFDWFIYLNWNHNIYRYEYGIIRHTTLLDLPQINIFRICNKDQLMHWIDLVVNNFKIDKYPDIVFEKEKFLACIKSKFKEECNSSRS